jgi:type II secretory pathway pseudopilin PulG
MGINSNRGFTIIEVMLFLAVTGALAIGILASAGVSISQQRYRDSVNSLKSLLQTQYNEVTNVINSRGQDWTCNSAANIADTPEGAGQPRGTSECVVLGRLLTINETGTLITQATVVGYRQLGATTAPSDVQELQTNYTMAVSPINQETTEVSWGAQIVEPKTTTPMPLSMLVVRSPLSGALLTFTADGIQTNVKGMVTMANMQQTRDLCVNPDTGTFVGQRRLEVKIGAFANSQSAISIPVESESVCD